MFLEIRSRFHFVCLDAYFTGIKDIDELSLAVGLKRSRVSY